MTLILLGLFCCLLVTTGESGMGDLRVRKAVAVLTVDQASGGEWLCERTYNSDLGLPRVYSEVSAPVTVPTSLRTAASESGRVYARCLAARHNAPRLAFGCLTRPCNLSSGPHPVDHYVYRLRRLII